MFRRARFGDLLRRQLDLFEQEHAHVIQEAADKFRSYNEADRDEAEELYGDYLDAVETGTDLLADVRDYYARTLGEDDAERYEAEFNRAVARRLPRFAFRLEDS